MGDVGGRKIKGITKGVWKKKALCRQGTAGDEVRTRVKKKQEWCEGEKQRKAAAAKGCESFKVSGLLGALAGRD